jgi:methyltransferase (TIGR00027 family)
VREDRPSSTATLIAAATVFLARDPELRRYVPNGAAEICERCLPASLRAVAKHGALRWLGWGAERATIPGLMLHFMLRKRWIERAVREAIGRGCRQVIVLGAGFDTLCARLAAELPAVRFIEVDHPATHAVKRAALAGSPVELIAADLARVPLASALAGRLAPEPSAFVAEGLLVYLTPAELAALFAAVAALQPAGSEVVFTVMEPAADGRLRFHNATWLERALLALWKEPFKSAVPRERLQRLAAEHGYDLQAYADLAQAHPELRLARGELVARARRTGS